VAMWVHFALNAEAIPVSSALFMVLLIPTPPELTLMAVFVASIKTPAPTHCWL